VKGPQNEAPGDIVCDDAQQEHTKHSDGRANDCRRILAQTVFSEKFKHSGPGFG
jgi:hypothetical protein